MKRRENIRFRVKDISTLSIPDILFTKCIKIRLDDWHSGLLQEGNGVSQLPGSSSSSTQQLETIFFKRRPALSLKGFTSHQLRLIQSVVPEHFKYLIFVRAYEDLNCSSLFLEGGSTCAASYEVYKEICASLSKVLFADQAEQS